MESNRYPVRARQLRRLLGGAIERGLDAFAGRDAQRGTQREQYGDIQLSRCGFSPESRAVHE
ncbi:hypothetical protein AWC29_02250 [Mycobacterium triplex]|uniref:Uncharacterized protein n=1 Tax=Mycobacterium triplex TaxID=47839 RepID=A0ABX3W072_9MYCO|nr:hypothetical protein AWC29_02250 [Mycobacterium triplex]